MNEEMKVLVEVEVDDSKAKGQAEEAQKNLEDILHDVGIGIDLSDVKSIETGLEKIHNEMLSIQKDPLLIPTPGLTGVEQSSRMSQAWERFDKLEQAAIMLEDRLKELKDASDEAGDAGVKMTSEIGVGIFRDAKLFGGFVKQAVRFGLSLVGIQGLYTGISRAMNTWLGQNEELQNKINACWYALGSLFAPVLEWIVNMFVRLVGIVDALAKALGFAGINMSNYGKAGAKASKQLAGFDEINNVNKNSGAENPFGLSDLGDKFQDMLSIVKANAELISLFGLGAMFGIGVGLFFMGHPGIGGALMIASGVLGYNYLKENWNDIIEKVGGVGNALMLMVGGFTAGLGLVMLFMGQPVWGLSLLISGLSIAATAVDWNAVPDKVRKAIAEIAAVVSLATGVMGVILLLTGHIALGLPLLIASFASGYTAAKLDETAFPRLIRGLLGMANDETVMGMNVMEASFSNGMMNINGDSNIIGEMIKKTLSQKWEDMKENAKKKLGDMASDIGSKFESIKLKITGKLDEIRQKFVDKWESLKSWWRNLELPSFKIKTPHLNWTTKPASGWISNILSTLGLPTSLPKLTVDWYAKGGLFSGSQIIGVGEYPNVANNPEVVAPLNTLKEYVNNDETNELLRQLISVVDSKEFKTYISQNEIGKSAVSYINSQSRILGESII